MLEIAGEEGAARGTNYIARTIVLRIYTNFPRPCWMREVMHKRLSHSSLTNPKNSNSTYIP